MSGSETGSEGAERGGGRRGGDLASKTLLLVNIPANSGVKLHPSTKYRYYQGI